MVPQRRRSSRLFGGSNDVRTQLLAEQGIVVVKVGTNVLANAEGVLDRARIASLADQIHSIRTRGWQVVLVSSGAIGAGVGKLNLGKRPTDLPHLQACAAIGQTALMQIYQECFAPHGILPAQILLTAGDFDNRARYLNVRNTILTLFEYQSLPIINENDTVAVAEIKFGDNDHLAAMVANLMQAKLLVLLTNVDGLYSADPGVDPTAKLLATVPNIDRSVTELAGATKSHLGTGGMRSKLKAARLATSAGGAVIMANGGRDGILESVFDGSIVGTLFLPQSGGVPAWKRWIGLTARPKGTLTIDTGAKTALIQSGKSLLPVGVRGVAGEFGKGDLVSICDAAGVEIARGLSNYSSVEAVRLAGLNTEQIVEQLGKVPYSELVHRDNLALMT
jgi:glutamate 5-kinase